VPAKELLQLGLLLISLVASSGSSTSVDAFGDMLPANLVNADELLEARIYLFLLLLIWLIARSRMLSRSRLVTLYILPALSRSFSAAIFSP